VTDAESGLRAVNWRVINVKISANEPETQRGFYKIQRKNTDNNLDNGLFMLDNVDSYCNYGRCEVLNECF
jgi:hypothetical protein